MTWKVTWKSHEPKWNKMERKWTWKWTWKWILNWKKGHEVKRNDMNEWMNERMNEWTNERMNEWTNEELNEWRNDWMNEWMSGWMNAWSCSKTFSFIPLLCEIELWLQSHAHAAGLIFQGRSETDRCFYGFECQSNSRYCLVHILLTPSSKSAPRLTVFCKSSSRCNSVRFCRLLQSTPESAETETLLQQPRKPLYPKKRQASHHAFPSCYVPHLLNDDSSGWHDDVVEMMVRMLPMKFVRNLEVF